MDHEHAVRELLAERYLLGELTGAPREAFEAHLFECTRCAADVTSSVRMAEALRAGLLARPMNAALVPPRFSWMSRWLQPIWLAPALTACLLLVCYQNAVELPALRRQAAHSDVPEVMSTLVLAGGIARGGNEPHIAVARGKSFLLSVDIPLGSTSGDYTCTLVAPPGAIAWSETISQEQARNSVQIKVPAAAITAGEQTLVIKSGQTVLEKMKFTVAISE